MEYSGFRSLVLAKLGCYIKQPYSPCGIFTVNFPQGSANSGWISPLDISIYIVAHSLVQIEPKCFTEGV